MAFRSNSMTGMVGPTTDRPGCGHVERRPSAHTRRARTASSWLGGSRPGEPGQEGGQQGEEAVEERGRTGVQRVLGEQLGKVDAGAGYPGGAEDVEHGLGDDAVSGGAGVDRVQAEQAPLEPPGFVRAVKAGIEADDGG